MSMRTLHAPASPASPASKKPASNAGGGGGGAVVGVAATCGAPASGALLAGSECVDAHAHASAKPPAERAMRRIDGIVAAKYARCVSRFVLALLTCAACGGPRSVEAPMTAAVDAGARAAEAEPDADAVATKDIPWRADEALAVHEARASRKPLLVHFWAAWCLACIELERQTFADADVRAAAARYVSVRIDATDDEAIEVIRLKRKYVVIGLPTVVLVDASGREMQRFTEFVTPERMAAALRASSTSP